MLKFKPIILLFIVFGLIACKKPKPVVFSPSPIDVKIAIGPGDELEIEVFREKELSKIYQVSMEGTIDFPLIGRVKASGLQPRELAELITKRLADGYLKKPYVSVFAKNYKAKQSIYVWGQVKKSGVFEYMSNMPLIKALALAGGTTPMASQNDIVVTRVVGGKRKTIHTPMGKNQSATYQLKPGDVVFVPERVF